MTEFEDPFLDEAALDELDTRAPADTLMGEWPTGDPVVFEIAGDPVPWAPAQMNRKTGGRFIPARQARQAARFIERWEKFGLAPVPKGSADAPGRGVVLGVEFYVERPKKQFGTGRNAHVLKDRFRGALPIGKPDLSNMIKLVEDALTTHAWDDDDQIVRIVNPTKAWGRPRTVVKVWLAPPSADPAPPEDVEAAVQAALL